MDEIQEGSLEPEKKRRFKETEPAAFSGFEYANPTTGYTQMANNNFALLAEITSLSEMKVILFLIRNTWGYQEYDQEKAFTTDEFVNGRKRKDGTRVDCGCGLKETAVKEGLAQAIAHGRVICTVDDSDKGRVKKYYKLKMNEGTKRKDELGSRNASPPSHEASDGWHEAPSNETQRDYRTETGNARKETLEINSKKEGEAPNITEASYSVPPSSQKSFYSFEEQRIDDYFFQTAGRRATQSKDTKKHWNTVSKKIESLERFESLYAHIYKAIKDDQKYSVKVVHPGNLAGYLLDDWEARQTSTDEFWNKQQPAPAGDKQDEFLAEEVRKVAKGLGDLERLEEYVSKVKYIYQCTKGVTEDEFVGWMREIQKLMIEPTPLTLAEAQQFAGKWCDGLMDYFTWDLAARFGLKVEAIPSYALAKG